MTYWQPRILVYIAVHSTYIAYKNCAYNRLGENFLLSAKLPRFKEQSLNNLHAYIKFGWTFVSRNKRWQINYGVEFTPVFNNQEAVLESWLPSQIWHIIHSTKPRLILLVTCPLDGIQVLEIFPSVNQHNVPELPWTRHNWLILTEEINDSQVTCVKSRKNND